MSRTPSEIPLPRAVRLFSCLRLGPQIVYSVAGAIGSAVGVAAILLILGGVYYVFARKQGVTFREAIFNWPLVIVTSIVAFLAFL